MVAEKKTECPVCSVGRDTEGNFVIWDYRKWLASPIPCHDCETRRLKRAAQIGRDMALKREQAILDTILSPKGN